MSGAAFILLAWGVELIFGWPDWLYKRCRHPVVWFGAAISRCEQAFNKDSKSHKLRYVLGAISSLVLIVVTTGIAMIITTLLPNNVWGLAAEAIIASSLIASKSLYIHVQAVARPLSAGDLDSARRAVSMIVGRDPTQLDEADIASAALESLAENASDGVIAPLFWGAIGGLPALTAYKAINTLDSMVGHKTKRYHAYGGFAARLDDLANIIPARLTGILLAFTSLKTSSFKTMFQDAHKHRSPNAGWPEAAMAGALNLRLSGPRIYDNHVNNEPWLNEGGRPAQAQDIARGLALFVRAMGIMTCLLILLALGQVAKANCPSP